MSLVCLEANHHLTMTPTNRANRATLDLVSRMIPKNKALQDNLHILPPAPSGEVEDIPNAIAAVSPMELGLVTLQPSRYRLSMSGISRKNRFRIVSFSSRADSVAKMTLSTPRKESAVPELETNPMQSRPAPASRTQ